MQFADNAALTSLLIGADWYGPSLSASRIMEIVLYVDEQKMYRSDARMRKVI